MKKDLNRHLKFLAKKYFKTDDLSKLTPYQLDKLSLWATNIKPTQGQNQDRKAGRNKGRYIKGLL